MFKKNSLNATFYITIAVIVIIIFRFVLITVVPLLDKTEARYAEIARIMSETSEWVVLQIEYGFPFWAKPPLSTWLSALSFEALGANELTARLPSFLLSIGLLIILGKFIKKTGVSFYLPAFILLTTPEYLIHTGVVSTDTVLSFSVALIMLSFWKAMQKENHIFWGYLFFIALGLGFLSKGPLVLVLTAPPIFLWILIQRIRIKDIFTNLPWISGLLVTIIITIPWYLLAEKRSPGFLNYFIVGEHFSRFLDPKWTGDLYGGPKSEPLGMIWVFLLLVAFPWIQVVFIKLWQERKKIFKNDWVSFLVLWLLWTPFFFTFSKNVLYTYVLPVMVPMALLMIHWWPEFKRKKLVIGLASLFPAAAIIFFIGITINGKMITRANSDKYLISKLSEDKTNSEIPIYYWLQKSYSGEFYTKGKAEIVLNTEELDSVLTLNKKIYLFSLKKKLEQLPEAYIQKLELLDSNYKTSVYFLAAPAMD